ncbi:phosphotransferase [bacterium]|nr:phosphotransferase [bacterium]
MGASRSEKLSPVYDDAALDQLVGQYQAAFERFRPIMQHKLPANQIALLEQIATRLPPQRRAAMLQGAHMTLVHRDTHPGNFLYSFNNVKLIDWQSWRTDCGLDDVAYLIACHLPEPVQRLDTRVLLQKYFNTLQKSPYPGLHLGGLPGRLSGVAGTRGGLSARGVEAHRARFPQRPAGIESAG